MLSTNDIVALFDITPDVSLFSGDTTITYDKTDDGNIKLEKRTLLRIREKNEFDLPKPLVKIREMRSNPIFNGEKEFEWESGETVRRKISDIKIKIQTKERIHYVNLKIAFSDEEGGESSSVHKEEKFRHLQQIQEYLENTLPWEDVSLSTDQIIFSHMLNLEEYGVVKVTTKISQVDGVTRCDYIPTPISNKDLIIGFNYNETEGNLNFFGFSV